MSWSEKSFNFLKEITELTGNVKSLQDQMERVLTQLEKTRDEVRELKSDIRVLEKEIQVKAMETVVNAHTQIIERVLKLEAKQSNVIPHNGEASRIVGDFKGDNPAQ